MLSSTSPVGDEHRPSETKSLTILEHWVIRLGSHFKALADSRGERAPPLFSLEHGLQRKGLEELTEHLGASLRSEKRHVKSQFLPWVVHAAEVGYRYEGDEFWRSFGASTPGWDTHGDRGFIRRCFQRFASEYGGVVPTGSFAQHFSIIAWPIRHALLPKDLQLQFARTLFELRHRFESGDEHVTPGVVGRQISLGARGKSGRFSRFCEDHRLVGEIAIAVMDGGGGNGGVGSIHRETLSRVVRDIEAIREARTFLDRARAGYRKGVLFEAGTRPSRATSGEVALDQRLRVYLRQVSEESWSMWVRLPHLATEGESSTELRSKLRRTRVGLRGQNQSILGARLLFPNAVERLDSWPGAGSLLIAPESKPELRELLDEISEFPSGPPWVFKLTEAGDAQLLRGNVVRPGSKYVVFTDQSDPPMEDHLTLASVATTGVNAYELRIPRPTSELLRFRIERLGLSLAPQVRISPVGFVPSAWDYEGVLEVLATEPCLLGIETDEEITGLSVLIGEDHWRVPATGTSTIVDLGRIPQGQTTVRLMLEVEGGAGPTTCEVEVHSRLPRVWGDEQAGAGALLMETSPPAPTLEEFWSEGTQVWVDGPRGLNATVTAELRNYDGERDTVVLSDAMRLPIRATQFRQFRAEVMKKASFVGRLDYSELCEFVVRSEAAGGARISLEREATALRWAVSFADDKANLALIDNSDSDALTVRSYQASSPFGPVGIPLARGGAARRLEMKAADPGLYVATTDLERVGSIVPPAGSRRGIKLSELQSGIKPPSLDRSHRGIRSALSILADWSAGHPCGNRVQADQLQRSVLRALGEALLQTVGGHMVGGVVRVFHANGSADRALMEMERTVGSRGWLQDIEDAYETLDHTGGTPMDHAADSHPLHEALVRSRTFVGAAVEELRACIELCGAALFGNSLNELIDPPSLSKRILDDSTVLAASTYLVLRRTLDAD